MVWQWYCVYRYIEYREGEGGELPGAAGLAAETPLTGAERVLPLPIVNPLDPWGGSITLRASLSLFCIANHLNLRLESVLKFAPDKG